MTMTFNLLNITLFEMKRAPFINDETFSILMLVNPAIITCGISIFGIGANIVNIITFTKLGFKETIHVSLVALAVTDLANLLFLLWMTLSYNPSFCDLVCDYINLKELEDALIGDQRSFFTTVGGCITCLIACERCLCVLRPLQVKLMLTKKRLKIILPSIFIVCLIPYSLMFYTTGMTMEYIPETNHSSETENIHYYMMHEVNLISYCLVMVLSLSTYVIVIVFTSLIVWKLASQSEWRANQARELSSQAPNSTTGNNKPIEKQGNKKGGLSGKDRRATMTVTVIAAMYITCFFPGTVFFLAMSVAPEFNKGMLYTNLYDFSWYLAYVGESICSSANIIVYLRTSAKFKVAFLHLFRRTPPESRSA